MTNFNQFEERVAQVKSEIFGEIDRLVEEMKESGDVEKFYEKGVKSAGGRLRKNLQLIRKAIHHPTNRTKMASIQDAAKELRSNI